MKFTVKHFNELTPDELWEIFAKRSEVFVVEQNCAYQDIDECDRHAYHVAARDESGLIGYARVLPRNTMFDEVSIGRVISLKRRCGVGTAVMARAIEVARERFFAERIEIKAQCYAVPFYEASGFKAFGEVFDEDGIPHIHMMLEGIENV